MEKENIGLDKKYISTDLTANVEVIIQMQYCGFEAKKGV